MKRVMILGAGVYQLPLIETAGKMGLETVVLSRPGNYPGTNKADIFLDIDTTDEEMVLQAAKSYNISGITSTGSDACVPAIGKVVDELKLPGTGFAASCRSSNKVLMKKAFKENDVPSAKYEVFRDKIEARRFAAILGYPVMIKAPDSSGSRGVVKVDEPGQFDDIWDYAMDVSRSKNIIIEEFLTGVEFGAQAIVTGNRVLEVFPHNDTVTPAPNFVPIGHSMPALLNDQQKKETIQLISRAVAVLGIRDCISNVDLILTREGVKIIEIAARMGGTCIPESISIFAGIDAYEQLINMCLGRIPDFQIKRNQPNASLLLRSGMTGILASLEIPVQVTQHPDLVAYKLDAVAGNLLNSFTVGRIALDT